MSCYDMGMAREHKFVFSRAWDQEGTPADSPAILRVEVPEDCLFDRHVIGMLMPGSGYFKKTLAVWAWAGRMIMFLDEDNRCVADCLVEDQDVCSVCLDALVGNKIGRIRFY